MARKSFNTKLADYEVRAAAHLLVDTMTRIQLRQFIRIRKSKLVTASTKGTT